MALSPFSRYPHNPRNAFTLVEVLVVTVIAGVLISLLVIQVNAFLRKAKATTCASNMRQLGLCILQYSTEYNGELLPTLQRTDPLSGSGITWHEILSKSGVLSSANWHQKPNSIMRCPARTSPNPRGYGNSLPSREFNGVHYGMNSYPGVSNLIALDAPRNKLVTIERPSQTLLLTESNWGYLIYPHLTINRIGTDVHGGCNLLYADGHVEFYKGELPVYSAGQLKPDADIPPFLRR